MLLSGFDGERRAGGVDPLLRHRAVHALKIKWENLMTNLSRGLLLILRISVQIPFLPIWSTVYEFGRDAVPYRV